MKTVAILSGGLDSFCYTALFESQDVYPITFLYSQKGRKEVTIAKKLSEMSGFHPIKIIDLSSLGEMWSGNQLTDHNVSLEGSYKQSVVVPLRNAVFITIAAGYAFTVGAEILAYGAHSDDVGITAVPLYPDCSVPFIKSIQTTLNLGHFSYPLCITSPSVKGLSKADTIVKGYEKYKNLIFETWSCYDSQEKQCGVCESCRNRKTAFKKSGIEDLTEYSV